MWVTSFSPLRRQKGNTALFVIWFVILASINICTEVDPCIVFLIAVEIH